MTTTAPPAADWSALRPRTTRSSSRLALIAICAVTALVAALVATAIIAFLHGARWYIVETPSMGTAAPVGTLVIDTPASFSSLNVGDIISFHPPTTPAETYTHRIISNEAGVIHTKGDANGAVDPWALGSSDVVGRAIAVIPVLGWLIRAIPLLTVGVLAVLCIAYAFRSASKRAAIRVVGFSLVIAITTMILRPFINVAVEATRATEKGTQAILISTGILPIRAQVLGGSHVDLASGQTGSVIAHSINESGHYAISASLNLPWFGWILFALVCAIPLLWTLIIGLPVRENELER
jgi:signal peptidase I